MAAFYAERGAAAAMGLMVTGGVAPTKPDG